MPIVPESYDRSPLSPDEQTALASLAQTASVQRKQQARRELLRLQRPIFDVAALRMQHDTQRSREMRKFVYEEMLRRGRSFWEWSQEEWISIICPTHKDFLSHHRLGGIRPSLIDMAYLLGGVTDLRPVNVTRECTNTAQHIFGSEVIEQEFRKITEVLVGPQGRGYREGPYLLKWKQALCLLLLLNRSPYLEELSEAVFQQATASPCALEPSLLALLRSVLQELHLLKPPEEREPSSSKARYPDTSEIPQEWVQWCLAWLKQTPNLPLSRRRRYLEILFTAGRWLSANHPGMGAPSQWDEPLALDYVNFVCTSTAGEYASAAGIKSVEAKGLTGKPLAPRSIHNKLAAMSRFFRDLQDRPYAVGKEAARKIARRFLPREIFATPSSVKRLIQPDPRDLDELSWCKLTYAAATLTEEDCTAPSSYPLSYYRAVALLWVTSARRANEIRRLRVGCIRRDWDPEMLNEHGVPFPEHNAQLCYLHVPPNKTKGAYWVPIPQYVADAIEVWERERPLKQRKLIDSKDNSLVDFLFCFRGSKMGRQFLNDSLIPALCKRAGVPESDARGTITSHRARSTIATMLRRNGLSLEDISEFLGHAKPEMVRAYARTDPFRFGRQMNRTNDLMRIVEGIIDTRAAKAGKPNVFFFLGRGQDGQPRFCGNPAWEKCTHRLACLKCPMYIGAGQASRLAERLEVRDELFKFQTQVVMTPLEQAAAQGDIETVTALMEADAAVPPPEPSGEQFRFTTPLEQGSPPLQTTQADLVDLGCELAALTRELVGAEKRADGRNANIRALKKRIAEVTEQMAALDQITILTKASLGT